MNYEQIHYVILCLCFLLKEEKQKKYSVSLVFAFFFSHCPGSLTSTLGTLGIISQDNVQMYYSSRLSVIINSFPRGYIHWCVFNLPLQERWTLSYPIIHCESAVARCSFLRPVTHVFTCADPLVFILYESTCSARDTEVNFSDKRVMKSSCFGQWTIHICSSGLRNCIYMFI